METFVIHFRRLPLVIVCALALLNGCEEVETPPSTIQFTTSLQNVAEGGEVSIQLTLDKPARETSTITVVIETLAVIGENFQIVPSVIGNTFELVIEKGMKKAMFTVESIDDETVNNGKYIVFKLLNPSQALKLGTLITSNLLLGDDESPAFVNFSADAGTISESASTGIDAQIVLSSPAIDDGLITLTFDGLPVYGKDFVTNPAAVNNSLTLQIEKDQSTVSFAILPIDNELLSGSLNISVSITSASGAVQEGTIINYKLTITDDEVPSIAAFQITGWSPPVCGDYDQECEPPQPLSSGRIAEDNNAGQFVPILLSQPASGKGTIRISWKDSSYGTIFTTSPAPTPFGLIEIPVAKGDISSGFTVFPIDNHEFTDGSRIYFEIAGTSGVIQEGASLKHSLTISDDEIPSLANFPSHNVATINEADAEGIEVEITFSQPTRGQGSITVSHHNDGATFTTEPAQSGNNSITWNLGPNESGVKFRIKPTNNSSCSYATVSFSITSSGFIKVGDYSNYLVTFADDEASIATFEINAMTVNESDAAAKTVTINFSKPINTSSIIQLYLGQCNSKVATTPDCHCIDDDLGGSSQILILNVPEGATSTSFKVCPNNNDDEGDSQVDFSPLITNNTCLQFAPNARFSLIIKDDD